MEHWYTQEKLEAHLRTWCLGDEDAQVTRSLPPAGKDGAPVYARFNKPAHLHRHPARVYADFETKEEDGYNRAISYAWVCCAHDWTPPRRHNLNIGEDCAAQFLKDMFALLKRYRFQPDRALRLTPRCGSASVVRRPMAATPAGP